MTTREQRADVRSVVALLQTKEDRVVLGPCALHHQLQVNAVSCCPPGSTSMDAPVWRSQVPPAHREQIPPLHRHVPAGRSPADEVHPQAEWRHQHTPGSEAGLRPVVVCYSWGTDGQRTLASCSGSPSTRWATRMAKTRADKLRMMVVRAEAAFKIKASRGICCGDQFRCYVSWLDSLKLGGSESLIALHAVLHVRMNT